MTAHSIHRPGESKAERATYDRVRRRKKRRDRAAVRCKLCGATYPDGASCALCGPGDER